MHLPNVRRYFARTPKRDVKPAPVAAVGAHYGWIPSPPDLRDSRWGAESSVLTSLPDSVDLESTMPDVYAQLSCNACTGNAIAAVFAHALMVTSGAKVFAPSRLFIYYCERALEGTVASDGGAYIRDGFKVLDNWGVPPEDAWPYTLARLSDRPPADVFKLANNAQALSYARVPQQLTQMQACLATGTPFVFGFTVYESFESIAVARSGIVPLPSPTEKVLGGHAVVCVGYDSSRQAFKIRNSWGADWGLGGHCWMPYQMVLDASVSGDIWALTNVEV